MANMGTVSVSYQQFRIKRNLQETKKPAHPSDKLPEWLGSKLSFSYPPPKNVLRFSGLASDHTGSLLNGGGGFNWLVTNGPLSHGDGLSSRIHLRQY